MAIEDGKKGEDEQEAGSKADGSNGAADRAEKMVPVSVLQATRADLNGQIARLASEVDSLKAGAAPKTNAEPEKTFTRAQLRASVNAGDISEDQMDEILESQLEKKIAVRVETTARTTVQTTETARTVQGEIDKYVDAHPDLIVTDSELRAKVQGEFDYLVKFGDNPKDPATQLKAIRAAVGPLTQQGRRKQPEHHEDVGGGGGESERTETAGWAKGLSATQKKHYDKLINSGVYKGATDPKLVAELKFIRKAH